MKKISVWTLFCLFSLFCITSCQKENIDTVVEIEEPTTPTVTTVTPPTNALLGRASSRDNSATEGLDFDCITILFPFNLVDSEGNIHEVADETAFATLLSENGDTSSAYIVDFEFPINVSVNEGEVIEITDNEQLGELFAECIPDGGWDEFIFPAYLIDIENSCYKTVYPISLENTNGNIITVDDESAFIDVLVEQEVYFHFPIRLTDGEEEVTVNNVDELFATLFSCNENYGDSILWDWEEGFEYLYCFQVNFPMTVIINDGEEKIVNNHEELCELMLQGVLVDYAYPLTLISPEGETVTANSPEELEELLGQCDLNPWGPDGGIGVFSNSDVILLISFGQLASPDTTEFEGCYDINFPIEITYYNQGDTTTTTDMFNSIEEIWSIETLYGNGLAPDTQARLVYPIEVTRIVDNETVELNNIEEIIELVEACLNGL